VTNRRRLAFLAGAAVAVLLYVEANAIAIALESRTPSVSVGTVSRGRLVHGKRLPSRGANFRAYSSLGLALGRNTVNDRVRDAVVAAYAELRDSFPEGRFVYGECGWPRGGRFRPHRTHQNGLSVDFFVPVRGEGGAVTTLPTGPLHGFGYRWDFDSTGRAGTLVVDFDAVARHLAALDRAARRRGLRIALVIIAPEYRRALTRSRRGRDVLARLPFMQGPAWVRHDEHYHVDFARA